MILFFIIDGRQKFEIINLLLARFLLALAKPGSYIDGQSIEISAMMFFIGVLGRG